MERFDGDRGSLFARNKMLFELAETLSDERRPYARVSGHTPFDARQAIC
jgi:hypothetical protein